MMHLKPISAFLAAALLVLASLACNTITGGGVNNLQATANAALTAGFSGDFGATATAAQATVEAAINGVGEAPATSRPTEAGNNPAEATETPAAAVTESTGFSGAPDDVPILDAQNTVLISSADVVSYQTDADFATAVQFYKDEMPNNGWTFEANLSVETNGSAVLTFTKDNRRASVTVTLEPNTKTVIIAIAIVAA
jgi:hypothetical protein